MSWGIDCGKSNPMPESAFGLKRAGTPKLRKSGGCALPRVTLAIPADSRWNVDRSSRLRADRRVQVVCFHRQFDNECGPPTDQALDTDAALVLLDDLPAHAQSQPSAAVAVGV